jgi:hypothetical protein
VKWIRWQWKTPLFSAELRESVPLSPWNFSVSFGINSKATQSSLFWLLLIYLPFW